jgi:hypothetical protein
MLQAFDLSEHSDVAGHADAILGAFEVGRCHAMAPGPRPTWRNFRPGLTRTSRNRPDQKEQVSGKLGQRRLRGPGDI